MCGFTVKASKSTNWGGRERRDWREGEAKEEGRGEGGVCEHGSGDSNSSLVFTSLTILGQYVSELRSPNALNRFWSSISGQRVNKKESKDHLGAMEMFWTTLLTPEVGSAVFTTAFHQGGSKRYGLGEISCVFSEMWADSQYASWGRWFFYFLKVVHKVNKDVHATVHGSGFVGVHLVFCWSGFDQFPVLNAAPLWFPTEQQRFPTLWENVGCYGVFCTYLGIDLDTSVEGPVWEMLLSHLDFKLVWFCVIGSHFCLVLLWFTGLLFIWLILHRMSTRSTKSRIDSWSVCALAEHVRACRFSLSQLTADTLSASPQLFVYSPS